MIGLSLLALVLSSGINAGSIDPPALQVDENSIEPVVNEIKIPILQGQFVAFQDGDNPWKVIPNDPKSTLQTVQVSDSAGRYSIFMGPVPNSKALPSVSLFHSDIQ